MNREAYTQVRISWLVRSKSDSIPAQLWLAEAEGQRRFCILIGRHEADAIALLAEHAGKPLPLPYDMTSRAIEALGGMLRTVSIEGISNGIYDVRLRISRDEERIQVRCRLSDGVAMAMRCGCALYVENTLLDIMASQDADLHPHPKLTAEIVLGNQVDLSQYSMAELTEALQQAVGNEQYEAAARLRDAIDQSAGGSTARPTRRQAHTESGRTAPSDSGTGDS